MIKQTVMLKSINDVKDFVNFVNRFDFDIDLIAGRYVVDAKSLMGIFSLNLNAPIDLVAYSDNCPDLTEGLKAFSADN